MKNRGQSVLEVAVLTVIVVAALIAVQIYIKRSFQGRYRDLADSVGEQYDPLRTSSTRTNITETTSTAYNNRPGARGFGSLLGFGLIPTYAIRASESKQTYTTTNTTSEDYNVGDYPVPPVQ